MYFPQSQPDIIGFFFFAFSVISTNFWYLGTYENMKIAWEVLHFHENHFFVFSLKFFAMS